MNISQAVIARILELCDEKQLSINSLSGLADITQSTVSDIVNGMTYNTGIATIRKLCFGFGIDVREFFNSELFEHLDTEEEKPEKRKSK